ncbi:MAG: hypothetical protein ACYS47_14325, partial [Planctomycetota bacterium]
MRIALYTGIISLALFGLVADSAIAQVFGGGGEGGGKGGRVIVGGGSFGTPPGGIPWGTPEKPVPPTTPPKSPPPKPTPPGGTPKPSGNPPEPTPTPSGGKPSGDGGTPTPDGSGNKPTEADKNGRDNLPMKPSLLFFVKFPLYVRGRAPTQDEETKATSRFYREIFREKEIIRL